MYNIPVHSYSLVQSYGAQPIAQVPREAGVYLDYQAKRFVALCDDLGNRAL